MRNCKSCLTVLTLILIPALLLSSCTDRGKASAPSYEPVLTSTAVPTESPAKEPDPTEEPEAQQTLDPSPEPLEMFEPNAKIKSKSPYIGTYSYAADEIIIEKNNIHVTIDSGLYYPGNIIDLLLNMRDVLEAFNGLSFGRPEIEGTVYFHVTLNSHESYFEDGIIYLAQEDMFIDGGRAVARIAGVMFEKLLSNYCRIDFDIFGSALKYTNMKFIPDYFEYNKFYNGFILNRKADSFETNPEEIFRNPGSTDGGAAGFRIAEYIGENFGAETMPGILQESIRDIANRQVSGDEIAEILINNTNESIFEDIAKWSKADIRFKSDYAVIYNDSEDDIPVYPIAGAFGWSYEPVILSYSVRTTLDYSSGLSFLSLIGCDDSGIKGAFWSKDIVMVESFNSSRSRIQEIHLLNGKTEILDKNGIAKIILNSSNVNVLCKINNMFLTDPDGYQASLLVPASTPMPTAKPGSTGSLEPTATAKPETPVLNAGIQNSAKTNYPGPEIPNLNTGAFIKASAETTLQNNKIQIIIDPGIIYSACLLEYVGGLVDSIEEVTGLSFFNDTNKNYGKITLRIWGGYLTNANEDYISLSSEYAIAEGGNMSWDLSYELAKHILFRTCIPYVAHYNIPAISNPTLEEMAREAEEFPDVFIDAFAFDCADRVTSAYNQVAKADSYSRYYNDRKSAENMQNPEESFKKLYATDSKPFAFRFMTFMKDNYGEDILFDILPEIKKILSRNVRDTDIINIMKKLESINEDVFPEFKKWSTTNSSYFNGAEDKKLLDFTDVELVEFVPNVKYYMASYPFSLFEYDGSLTIDFKKGFNLMQMYGSDISGISVALNLIGEQTVEFYDVNGELIESFYVGDIIFIPNVHGAATVKLTGDASIVRLMLYDADMYSKPKWKPSNERITELPSKEIDITPSTPVPEATNPPSPGTTNPPSTSVFRNASEIQDFLMSYKTVTTSVGEISLNISVNSGAGGGTDYHFFIMAGIASSQFYDIFIYENYPQYTDTVKSQLETHMENMAKAVIGYASYQSMTGGYTGGPGNVINCAWRNYSEADFKPGSFRWISSEWNWLIMMD